MAGSKKWYIYQADSTELYAVELDEDTGSAAPLGFQPYTANSADTQLPRGTVMRYVNCVQMSGDGAGYRHRQFPCGSTDAPAFETPGTTININGFDYQVTSSRGEKVRRPIAANSGLQGQNSTVGGST